MESPNNNEGGAEKREDVRSLIEQKKLEAFEDVLGEIDARLERGIKETFTSKGKEYPLSSAEDCMVAYAQHIREQVKELYEETITRDKYREEQALVKILRLFEAYEKMVSLYAEIKSYYPGAAARVEGHLPSLEMVAKHGEALFKKMDT